MHSPPSPVTAASVAAAFVSRATIPNRSSDGGPRDLRTHAVSSREAAIGDPVAVGPELGGNAVAAEADRDYRVLGPVSDEDPRLPDAPRGKRAPRRERDHRPEEVTVRQAQPQRHPGARREASDDHAARVDDAPVERPLERTIDEFDVTCLERPRAARGGRSHDHEPWRLPGAAERPEPAGGAAAPRTVQREEHRVPATPGSGRYAHQRAATASDAQLVLAGRARATASVNPCLESRVGLTAGHGGLRFAIGGAAETGEQRRDAETERHTTPAHRHVGVRATSPTSQNLPAPLEVSVAADEGSSTWMVGRLVVILLALAIGLGAAACGDEDEGTEETTTEETTTGEGSFAAGRAVFVESCGQCHTLSEAGTSGSIGPSLDGLSLSTAEIEEQVRNGGGGMPAFEGDLSDDEIENVSSYVAEAAGG